MDKKLEEDTMTGARCSEDMLRYARAHPSLKVMPELQLVSEFKDELQSGEPSQQANMMKGEVNESVQDCVSQVSSKDFSEESRAIPDGQKGPKENCYKKR